MAVVNKQKNDLIDGPITKSLVGLATPMIIAFGFQTSFNFVDRFFVSRLGDVATAAIGMAFIIQLIIIALGSGMGMGLNSFISRSLGADKEESAISAALHSFFLALIIGVGVSIVGLATQNHIFRFLGARGVLLESITSYLGVVFLFAPVLLLSMLSNNIFRGWGDTVYPMKFMMAGTLLNIVLDPIMIFGWGFVPAMGIKGAALATGISRTISLIYMLSILVFRAKPVKLRISVFKYEWRIVRGIFQVGFPASIGQILTSFSLSLIFLILKPFGNDARAAYTIAFTYEMVAFLPVIGIGQAIAIMTGYNYGAQKYKRVRTIYFTGLKIAVSLMFVVSLVVSLDPGLFASLFAQSPHVLAITAIALRIMAPGYLFNGVFMCTATSFQGLGLGRDQLVATLLRMFLFMLPLAYFGSWVWALKGVWSGILVSNVFMAGLMLVWYRYLYYHKLIKGKIATLR
jgi:putative MATE family efflux protein